MRAASEAGFEINIDQPIDSIETLKMKAEEAKKSLSDIDVNIDSSNLSAVDTQIEKTQAYIKQINDLDLSPDVKADKLEYANDILEYFLTRKQELGQTENIDVVINIDESELNKGYETLGNLKGALEQINGNIVLSVDRHNAQVEIKSSSTDKAAEKSEKASEKIIDFVEIAIKRIEEGIKRIKITAESVFKTFTKRNESLDFQPD